MNIKTIIQSVYYLLDNNKPLDKLSILKLIFFADRYHLRKYSRMITNDTYYAMKYGPVASNVKNILDFDFIGEDEKLYVESYLKKENKLFSISSSFDKLDMLSETDKEALDFAIDNFGSHKTFDLVEITHQYPEWKRFEVSLKDGLTREKIVPEDFFENTNIENDPFKSNRVYLFKNKNFDTNSPSHYHIALSTKNGKNIVLSMITSQVDKKTKPLYDLGWSPKFSNSIDSTLTADALKEALAKYPKLKF